MNRIILFLLLLTACEPTKKEANSVPTRLAIIQLSHVVFVPTQAELALAQRLVLKRLSIYNAEQTAINDEIKNDPDSLAYRSRDLLNFDQYYKQCSPNLNTKGEKILVFNCMCDVKNFEVPYRDWRKHYIRVHDGGSCFFVISVNLTRQVVFGFEVNGET